MNIFSVGMRGEPLLIFSLSSASLAVIDVTGLDDLDCVYYVCVFSFSFFYFYTLHENILI